MKSEPISFQTLIWTAFFCYSALPLQHLGCIHISLSESSSGDKEQTCLRLFLQSCKGFKCGDWKAVTLKQFSSWPWQFFCQDKNTFLAYSIDSCHYTRAYATTAVQFQMGRCLLFIMLCLVHNTVHKCSNRATLIFRVLHFLHHTSTNQIKLYNMCLAHFTPEERNREPDHFCHAEQPADFTTWMSCIPTSSSQT